MDKAFHPHPTPFPQPSPSQTQTRGEASPLQVHPEASQTQRVSVLIVTYQGREYVGRCIDAIQKDAATLEVVVVDNGSDDGTDEYVANTFPETKVIRSRDNLGYGGGNNKAACYAIGHYLMVVNQDLVVGPHCIETLAQALESHPKAAMATPKILLYQKPHCINTCGNYVHFTGITGCRGLGEPDQHYSTPEEVLAVSGAAFMIRTDAFKELGGFDDAFFLYMEDTDLSLRSALAGYTALYVPEALAYHDFVPQFRPGKVFWLERNRYIMLLKLFHWRTLGVLLPALILAELVTFGYSALAGPRHLWAKFQAYGWLVNRLGLVMNKRRETQAKRMVQDREILAHCQAFLPFDEPYPGPLGQMAQRIFAPIFAALYRMAMGVVRW